MTKICKTLCIAIGLINIDDDLRPELFQLGAVAVDMPNAKIWWIYPSATLRCLTFFVCYLCLDLRPVFAIPQD